MSYEENSAEKLFFTKMVLITTSMIAFADDHKEKKDVDAFIDPKQFKSG